MNATCFNAHDLIRFDPVFLDEIDLPDWLRPVEADAFYAVIRRSLASNGLLPVGLRGKERNERWAAWLPSEAVKEHFSPESLLKRVQGLPGHRIDAVPALKALIRLHDALRDQPFSWGPGGSVGFELASGRPTATTSSDLDIILRCPAPIGKDTALWLVERIRNLEARCDVSLETPAGAVALAEFAHANGPMAVKTVTGPRLIENPWS